MAHQNYGEGVFEYPPHLFVSLIFQAYEREATNDLKDLWKLNVIAAVVSGAQPKTFEDWLDGLKNHECEQEDIDPMELLERMKKDLGKG